MPTPGKLSKKSFNLVLRLLGRAPWLQELGRDDELAELFDLCSGIHQQSMLADLLARFEHLTESDFDNHIRAIVGHVFDKWLLPANRTQIVGMSTGRSPDSGAVVAYAVRRWLSRRGIDKSVRVREKIDYATEHSITHDRIVLVDEFAGTGTTALNRVSATRNNCRNYRTKNGLSGDIEIRVCLVACMADAQSRIRDQGIELFCPIILKKGLTGHLEGEERQRAIKRMLKLESELAREDDDGEKIPTLGWGRAEAAYHRDAGHIPNSVFPVFWWPLLKNRRRRRTLFDRYLGK